MIELEKEKEFDWSFLKTRKVFLLLPWIAPCYVAIKVWLYLWMYLNDVWMTIKRMDTEEREAYIESFEEEKAMRKSEFDMISIAFIVSGIFYLAFGKGSLVNVFSEIILIWISAIVINCWKGMLITALLYAVLHFGLKHLKGEK
ncbi:TPA: hypothetical protein R2K44_002348 [Raoultella ornithinolytica]|jgi:ABC-type sugar transport system permease subunit|nr:hypothetical protein [Raoultella ornithinolytica]